MVCHIIAGHLYAVLDEDNNASACTCRRFGTEMEQNGLGHGFELILLGLHTYSGNYIRYSHNPFQIDSVKPNVCLFLGFSGSGWLF